MIYANKKIFMGLICLLTLGFLSGCAPAEKQSTENSAALTTESELSDGWKYGLPPLANQITLGGQGGNIIRVTSLESSGPGTLREALNVEGKRIIVFDVAGIINLDGDNIDIRNPNVTIAGQTAPSPGITIIKGGLVVRANGVIIQHLKIRTGDLGEAFRSGRDIDGITTIAAHNVVVDHCSLSWATDENLSASGPRFTGENLEDWRNGTSKNILYSNNIIAEGLSFSTHAKGEHSKGSLIHDNVSGIYIYSNLYAHNFERSPLFKGGVQGSIINNLIYNPGQRAIQYNLQGLEWGEVEPVLGRMDLLNNAVKGGPSTHEGLPMLMIGGIGDVSIHRSGNQALDKWGNNMPIFGRYTSDDSQFIEADNLHFPVDGLRLMLAKDVEAHVLAFAGARPWDRDKHDVRILADTAEGRGEIINSQEQVGGYPKVPLREKRVDLKGWDLNIMAPLSPSVLDYPAKANGT